ncbi:prostaglandin E synthase 2 [Neocloeon triangulifer]|uniref:prostaglandin E synthase 2 n=1 Tax=Neocloeon triangulifer TaxID=2078957 RepID=UPI00286F8550|nr:prostaglandin E synthase 2 [Neocloeon triangulifer]
MSFSVNFRHFLRSGALTAAYCSRTKSAIHGPSWVQCRQLSAIRMSPRKKFWLYVFIGVTGGATAGAGYTFYQTQQARIPILNKGTGSTGAILQKLPDIPPSRRIVSPTDNHNLHLVLFQYQTCPFCCKVRAFLDYHGFSYDVIEVNPVMRQQMRWSTYKKVPILLAKVDEGYQQMNDSSVIISVLTSFLHNPKDGLSAALSFYPSIDYKDDEGNVKSEVLNRHFLMFGENLPKDKTKESISEERKWRKWADEVLVHTLSPNVYRTKEEALQAFNWFSEVGDWEKHFSKWERLIVIYVGAMAMWMIGKKLKKRHNLKNEVRLSLYDECNFWLKELNQKKTPFMGGSQPNLSDLAVFGILNSIEGCDAFKDLETNTKIGPWYYGMKTAIKHRSGERLQ